MNDVNVCGTGSWRSAVATSSARSRPSRAAAERAAEGRPPSCTAKYSPDIDSPYERGWAWVNDRKPSYIQASPARTRPMASSSVRTPPSPPSDGATPRTTARARPGRSQPFRALSVSHSKTFGMELLHRRAGCLIAQNGCHRPGQRGSMSISSLRLRCRTGAWRRLWVEAAVGGAARCSPIRTRPCPFLSVENRYGVIQGGTRMAS